MRRSGVSIGNTLPTGSSDTWNQTQTGYLVSDEPTGSVIPTSVSVLPIGSLGLGERRESLEQLLVERIGFVVDTDHRLRVVDEFTELVFGQLD